MTTRRQKAAFSARRQRPWLPVMALLCLRFAANVTAGVDYMAEKNALWVTDYPDDFPCTPQLLAAVDSRFGWGKVTYDETGDTCTVDASLWIGKNDDTDTYFQVGSSSRPRQTLIVRGDVRVYSTFLEGQNSCAWRTVRARDRVNRLTVGVAGAPGITPSLLVDNRDRAGHTLVIGGFEGYLTKNLGGQLCVYHGTVGPVGDVPLGARHKGDVPVFLGGQDRVELVHAVIRGISRAAFGRHMTRGVFDGTRFEDCTVAVHANYQKEIRGCTFVNCGTAVTTGSREDLTLHDCVFRGNRRNWTIPYRRILAVDCEVDSYDKGAYSSEHDTFFVGKRHVVVRVLDADGTPVRKAAVHAVCERAPAAAEFDVCHAVTGPDGRTPGRDDNGALLLSDILIRAADTAEAAPRRTKYRYAIEARAGDRSGAIADVEPTRSWEEFTVRLGPAAAAPQ